MRKSRLFLTLLLAAMLVVSGSFFAARFHFISWDFAMRNSRLRKALDDLDADKRDLLLLQGKYDYKSLSGLISGGELEERGRLEGRLAQVEASILVMRDSLEYGSAAEAWYETSARAIVIAFTFILSIIVGLLFYAGLWSSKVPVDGKSRPIIKTAPFSLLSRFASIAFSAKDQTEIWNPLWSDWQDEYFAAIQEKAVWKMRFVNLRYTYSFLAIIVQKSPVGDLIGLIVKFGKAG